MGFAKNILAVIGGIVVLAGIVVCIWAALVGPCVDDGEFGKRRKF